MTSIPHKIPDLRRDGFRQGVPVRATAADAPAKRESRGGWTRGAPSLAVEHAGFYRLPFDTLIYIDGDADAPDGTFWYPLRTIRPEKYGDEVSLVSATVDLLPTYHDDPGTTDGSSDSLAWGDPFGLTAAIVIGKNLNLRPGYWTGRPADIVGLKRGAATATRQNDNTQPLGTTEDDAGPAPYLGYTHFPPGSFGDTLPVPRRAYFPFSGTAARIKEGETLDVALVLAVSATATIAAYTQGTIFGYAHASLVLARNTPDTTFDR